MMLVPDVRPKIVMAVIVLTHLAGITFPTPVPPIKQGFVLNEFIKHYEPAQYEAATTLKEHIRVRRATPGVDQPSLRINFTAHHRQFSLVLHPDTEVFCDDVIFEDGAGHRVDYDLGRAYVGTLEDDGEAAVRGVVTSDGLFDGTISTRLEDYYVEPVSRYLDSGTRSPVTYHSIVYKSSDVRRPKYTRCASQELHHKLRTQLDDDRHLKPHRSRERRWLMLDDVEISSKTVVNISDSTSRRNIIVNSPDTVYHLENRSSVVNILTNKPPQDNLNIRIVKVGPNSTIIRSKHPNDTKFPKILVGTSTNNDDVTNIVSDTDDWLLSRQHITKRATVDPKKTTCMLYLQADHLFYQKYGTEEACIEVMTRHVQRVNSIYKVTDFNQDGKSDNISFMIKRIKVHSDEALEDPKYRFPGNYGVEKFLELFSEEDYDAFCLAYMFTYRDFEMGTLGLAWTGDLKNAGGVCEKNGHYRGSMKSLNTGIVTLLNYGKHVPPAVSHVTLAHEIGHNFGSPHDPEICTPGGEDGNFIMFARATSGDKKNNNRFSPCSLNSINPVLNAKARSPKGCFTEPQAAICGNGVVEMGEQCDCGWEEDCRDTCCYPQRRYPPPDEPPCRLTPNSMCSPSQGPCCTAQCQLKFGDKCRDDNGCRDSSYCDGRGPHCPPSINKPNKTVCNEEFVCFMGECTGSICLAYGLESCQCLPGPHDPQTKACELCCKLPGDHQPCLSSFTWNSVPYDIPDMFSKPGTPCNDYNGYCDVFQKCREVDPSGPLATLRKLLLSEESIASFKRWLLDRWYYAALIFSSVLLILILSTRWLGKTTDLKLKAVTIIHSSTTETVRLPPETDGANVVIHPAAVRSKLPLKRRVHEVNHRRRMKQEAGNKKTKKADQTKRTAHATDEAPATSSPRKLAKKSTPIKDKKKKAIYLKKKKKSEVIDYSSVQDKIGDKTPEDDPLGKVRNWLMNSHNIAGSLSIRKSKSSPAGFSQSAAQNVSKGVAKPDQAKTVDERPSKLTTNNNNNLETNSKTDPQVKLQVVYKPPFKFSVKLKKPTEVATTVVKEINSRVSQRQQRAAILVKGSFAEREGRKRYREDRMKRKSRNLRTDTKATTPKGNEDDEKDVSDGREITSNEKISDGAAVNPKRLSHAEKDNLDEKKRLSVAAKDAACSIDTAMLISPETEEPVYQNTAECRLSLNAGEKIKDSTEDDNSKYCLKPDKDVDLLRMTSVECKTQSQHPVITPEDCKVASQSGRVSRNNSQQSKTKVPAAISLQDKSKECDVKSKRLKRDSSRESRTKNISSQKCPDLMRFPSTEATASAAVPSAHVAGDSAVPTANNKSVPKRLSVSNLDNLLDSNVGSNNVHTVPSDLEVLLSESEYLFSDA